MLSVGPQELAVVGVLLLLLIVFGSNTFANTARKLRD
jgi:Sec-independent protein translocase protein TatA